MKKLLQTIFEQSTSDVQEHIMDRITQVHELPTNQSFEDLTEKECETGLYYISSAILEKFTIEGESMEEFRSLLNI